MPEGTRFRNTALESLVLGLILLVALVVRAYYIHTVPQPPLFTDAKNYDETALRLLHTGVFSYWGNGPDAYVTPGYPLFLALVYTIADWIGGNRLMDARYAQALLSVVTIFWMYLIVRRLQGRVAASLAVVLGAVYVSMIWASAAILTETLFNFFFVLYLYVFLIAMQKDDWRWSGLGGAVLGLTALVRPTPAPLVVLLPLLYHGLVERRRHIWRHLGVALVAFSMVMAPWWLRNLHTFGHLILFATESGDPMFAGTDPYFRLGDKLYQTVPPGADLTQMAKQRIVEGFTHEPGLYLQWFTTGKWWYLFRRPWGWNESEALITGHFWEGMDWLHLPIVYAGWASVLLTPWWRNLRVLSFVLLILTGIQLLFLPLARYAFPMMPILIMMASVAVIRLLGLGFRFRRRVEKGDVQDAESIGDYPSL